MGYSPSLSVYVYGSGYDRGIETELAAGTKREKANSTVAASLAVLLLIIHWRYGYFCLQVATSTDACHLSVPLGPGANNTGLAGPTRCIPIAILGRRTSESKGSTASAANRRAGLVPTALGKIPVVIRALTGGLGTGLELCGAA